MPWEKGDKPPRPERPREYLPESAQLSVQPRSLAAFQAAWLGGLVTQGIGLRPQPWAGFSRPVGPGLTVAANAKREPTLRGCEQNRESSA
jgi:hypothetical protein